MRVLVVEDDERLCEAFRDYLEGIGHEPLIVKTAEAALVVLRETRPGAMLVDVRLPGMSGVDLLQMQSSRRVDVPIVMMSGMLSEHEALQCLQLGAIDYVAKPVVLEHVRDILRCLEPLAELTPAASRRPERRRAARARIALPVHVVDYGGTEWNATAVDLSTSGIKIRSDGVSQPGPAVRISFPLGDNRGTIQVASVLVRVDLDGYAFHFVNLTEAQQDQLRELVEQRLGPSPAAVPHARVLHSLTRAFNGSLDVDDMLRLALHALTRVTGHEVSSLHLLSDDGRTLQLRGDRGLSPALREINRELPVGEGLIGRVAATGQTARIAEVTAAPELWSAARPVVEREGTHGFVCVPLQTRGRILGTLSLGRTTLDPFTDAEVALLEAVANQVALALDNARLYSETRRQLEDLNEAQANVAAGERLSTIGKLTAGLVHEINNPLTAILGQAQLIMNDPEQSPEGRERLRIIVEETSRAARLLKSVLRLSRVRRAERRECALDAEVRGALRLLAPQLEFAGIRIVEELDPVPPVWADADHLRQVLLNLVENARQAMGEQETERVLTIRTRAGEGRVCVEVLDTGPGIPADVLPRIFHAFFTTKSPGEGTGLGLWVSSDIVEHHGGRLRAENRPEGGARFIVDLPQRRGT